MENVRLENRIYFCEVCNNFFAKKLDNLPKQTESFLSKPYCPSCHKELMVGFQKETINIPTLTFICIMIILGIIGNKIHNEELKFIGYGIPIAIFAIGTMFMGRPSKNGQKGSIFGYPPKPGHVVSSIT